jgi:hypothetical protein
MNGSVIFQTGGFSRSDALSFNSERDVVADHHTPRLFAKLRDEPNSLLVMVPVA